MAGMSLPDLVEAALKREKERAKEEKANNDKHLEEHLCPQDVAKEDDTVGLALSGGGMRSAMFCAGVLKTVVDRNVRIDCMSSVSGGGYVAASYMDWKFRASRGQVSLGQSTTVTSNGNDSQQLRDEMVQDQLSQQETMSPGQTPSGQTATEQTSGETPKTPKTWQDIYFDTILKKAPNAYARFDVSLWKGLYDIALQIALLVFNCVVLSLLSTASFFLIPAVITNTVAGEHLRSIFTANISRSELVFEGVSWSELELITALLLISIAMHLGNKVMALPRLAEWSIELHFIRATLVFVAIFSSIIAQACMLELSYLVTAHRHTDGVVSFGFKRFELISWGIVGIFYLVWLSLPGSPTRQRGVVLLVLGLQAYIVQLRVFDYYYDDSVRYFFDKALMPAALILLLSPLLQPIHDTLLFHIYRYYDNNYLGPSCKNLQFAVHLFHSLKLVWLRYI